jgi:hypothetical protein
VLFLLFDFDDSLTVVVGAAVGDVNKFLVLAGFFVVDKNLLVLK